MSTIEYTGSGAGTPTVDFLRRSRPRYGERLIEASLLGAGIFSMLTTIGIVAALFPPTIGFFQEVSVGEFFGGTTWAPTFTPARFGVLPLIGGTAMVTLMASLVALPIGLGAAMYLSEYASQRARRILKPALEVLAGVPTVVYGFFALEFVGPFLKSFIPGLGTFSVLSAGLVMGIMIVPTVASLSEDALSAVPDSLRQGAYALGSTKRLVTSRIVLPAALSGVVAAFVLGISRALGETMIVAIAAGGQPNLSADPREGMQTMTAFIAQIGLGDQPTGSTAYNTLFAVGALLFVMTLFMNMISIRLVRRFREVYE